MNSMGGFFDMKDRKNIAKDCPVCNCTLLLNLDQLRKAAKPIFKCPSCTNVIQLLPKQGKCGNCNVKFKYYPYKFEADSPYIKCNQCETINTVIL